MISIWRSAATLSAALPSWCRPITALSTVSPSTTSAVAKSWMATMLTTRGADEHELHEVAVLTQERLPRRFGRLLGELVRPVLRPSLGDLARAQPDGGVDVEAPAHLVARQVVPEHGLIVGGRRRHRGGHRLVLQVRRDRARSFVDRNPPSTATVGIMRRRRELAGEVVQRRPRLRRLRAAEVDAPTGQERLGLGGDLEALRPARTSSTARAGASRRGRTTVRPPGGGRTRRA